MAQFKLGRIRFVWQGAWSTGTTYAVDDVVSVGGKSYICQINHIASATFVSDLTAIPTKWNIIADGTTWRGNWSPQTLYNAGDEVKYGGIVYIATTGHTSANNTATTVTITNLDNISQPGSVILSYATTNPTPFPIGSTITVAGANAGYNGTYTVTNSTTSTVTYTNATNTAWNGQGTIYSYGGLEASQSYWNQFAPSFDWKGNWTVSTRYKTNDFVAYGGYVYVCVTPHQSASTVTLGLENNIGNWQVFNNGIIYLGTWSGSSVRYRVNDVVKWGSDLWICTGSHTSTGTSLDVTKFSIFVNGFEFQNSWSNSANYVVGDMVTYGGYTYTSIQNGVGHTPTSSPTYWQPFTTGFTFSGDWISSTAYKIGTVVRLGGYTYVATADNTNQTPSLSSAYWSKLNAGFNWTNSSTTYTNIAGTNTAGTGGGATFDITCSNTVYTITLHSSISMSGYASGNTIKILGTQVGGLSPSNDIIITVTSAPGGAISSFTVSGRSVTWVSGASYYQGDVAFFGSSSYICIQPHTSASGNRPDADTTGSYWNAIAVGTESAALTTTGDLLYYGANGPTRLPVGTEGQILRSTNGYPVWANYGLINNLVYVGPLGVDIPAPNYGLTIDKPWKTVRYACYQIEQGYLNPNAKSLLVRNKQFVMKEVNSYLSYTFQSTVTGFNTGNYQFACTSTASFNVGMPITFSASQGGVTAGTVYYINTIPDATHFTIKATYTGGIFALTGSFSSNFTVNFYYDQSKAERDAGLTYEGVVYDLTRGGTLKTVTNAKAFFTVAGNTYITTNTGRQITQFIAAQNYIANTLLPAILSNTPPVNNYQILAGVTSSNQAQQIIDNTITAETTALTYCQSLVSIVTAAMTAGSATSIPTPFQPNTTIDVKTGTYNEVLPIVIPENTALVGDELRTSVVQPAAAVQNLVNDVPKTTSALNRISAILPNLLTNQAVTPTSGNTTAQVFLGFPGATNTTATTTVGTNSAIITNIIKSGVGAAPGFSFTNPTGYNTSYLVGYGDGKAQMVNNYAFLKAEISAYLAFNYSTIWSAFGSTAQTQTTRDVGYILDAIQYDMTYGGNRQTIIAANAYSSLGTAQIRTAWQAATLAALTRLKTVLGQVIVTTTVTPTSGNVTSQVTTGTPGSAGSATFAQARVQEIYDAVNGTIDASIAASSTWVSAFATSANQVIIAQKSNIQNAAMNWVLDNYASSAISASLTYRDAGLIVDALQYDLLFGTNANSIIAGRAYYRNDASAQALLANVNNELSATLGAIGIVTNEVKDAVSTISIATNNVTNIINNGVSAAPAFYFTNPTGYNTSFLAGYGDGKAQLVQNYAFMQAEISAYLALNYSAIWTAFGSTAQTQTTRDVGYILDAIQYDMTYGGNRQTIIAANAYSSLSTPQIRSAWQAATLAALARLNTIVGQIVQAQTVTKTTTGSLPNTQTQLTTGAAGLPGAATFAQARVQEIYDAVNGTIDASITASTTWVNSNIVNAFNALQAKKSIIQAAAQNYVATTYPSSAISYPLTQRDAGLIVDALSYDTLYGTNFNGIVAGRAYYRNDASAQALLANTNNELTATLGAIALVQNLSTGVTTGITGDVGSTTAVAKAQNSAKVLYDVFANGLSNLPTLVQPDPTGYGTTLTNSAWAATGNTSGSTVGYNNGRAQILQNYAFIKAEIAAYLNTNYSGVWTTFGATNQAETLRDTTYILDAIRYDLTYGGNRMALITGSAYYSNYINQIVTAYLPATLAALARLQTILGQIVQGTSVTPSSGNVTSQVTTGSAGTAGCAAFVQGLVQNVINWINNGASDTAVLPYIGWASSDLQNAFAAVQNKRSEIASDATAWIQKFYQSVSYNITTSTRDAGLIVDAICYDMINGGNFNAIKAGSRFYSNVTSTKTVLSTELSACLGAVNFMKYKIAKIAGSGSVATSQNIISDITQYIGGSGRVGNIMVPTATAISSTYAAAAQLIYDNKPFIRAEILAYISSAYPSLQYNSTTCDRDVSYILDSLVFDLRVGGNWATISAGSAYQSALYGLEISSTETTATVDAYGYLKTLVQAIATNSVAGGSSPYQATVTQVRADTLQTVGNAGSASAVGALVDIITNIISAISLNAGVPQVTITIIAGTTTFTTSSAHGLSIGDAVVPQSTANGLVAGTWYYVASTPLTTTFTLSASYGGVTLTSFTNGTGLSIAAGKINLPSTAGVSAANLSSYQTLSGIKSTLQSLVSTFITTNYPTLTYNSAYCLRDIGYVVDMVGFDMMLGSNYLSQRAAMSYFQAQAAKAIGVQKRATVQSYRYLSTQLISAVSATNTTASNAINLLMTNFINIVTGGINEITEVTGTVTYNNTLGTINGAEILRANTAFLVNEATAWISSKFGGALASISGLGVTTTSAHNLLAGDPVVFNGISNGGITAGQEYWVLAVLSPTSFSITSTYGGTTSVPLTTVSSPSLTAVYYFNVSSCQRDMTEYVKALIYDLQYPGNYKALRAARLYLNAVQGSQLSDMFYVRQSCGVRNMTLNGLNGDLTQVNSYGTRRPTAGAYTSLDPGFGPNDSNVWINTRSTYCQNVSLFGTGCTGMKIDGALHQGGNRSIVANDYTTILSDGIGVWCTGHSALTELVSVFCYYSYSGYLSELGGRIRATNGNSSYGTWGVIAEGTDTQETPLYANLNNRAAQAYVTNVFTDSVNYVWRMEYENAGSGYTNATTAVSGAGYNVYATQDEFRDASVFETRIIDPLNSGSSGGVAYGQAINAGQGGTLYQITIAATDIALSTAYVGMRIVITGGTGVGQFSGILSYSNGTKVALVYKESFTTLQVTATTITNNLLTVASTTTLTPGMAIYLDTTINGLSANTLYYINSANFSSTQFQISLTSGGSGTAVNITTTGSVSINLYAAGFDHVVPGTASVTPLDLTTNYIIEPKISYTAPGYTATSRTLPATATWGQVTYGNGRYVAVATGSTATAYSLDGKTWTSGGAATGLSGTLANRIVYGGGYGATATVTIGGLGGSGAVLTVTLGVANSTGAPGPDQVASITVVNGGFGYTSPPTIVIAPTGVTGSNATATATVLNGIIQAVTVTSNGSGYTGATATAVTSEVSSFNVTAYGYGYNSAPQVTVSPPIAGATAWTSSGTATQGTYYTYLGNFYLATSNGTFTTTGPSFTSGSNTNGTVSLTYVATTATGTAVLTNYGVGSITLVNAGYGYTTTPTVTIADNSAKFVGISAGSTATAYLPAWSSGVAVAPATAWTAGNALPASTFASLAYGLGVYVAVGGASSAASSNDGVSWTSRTIPTLGAGTYSSVTWGAGSYQQFTGGTYVAIATGTNATAYSYNGASWTAGGNLPQSTTWTSVAYGNNRYVAIASNQRYVAYSLNAGQSWTQAPVGLPSAANWTQISYGQGLFFAVASGTNVAATSPDGITWTSVAMPSSSNWNSVAFGSIPNLTIAGNSPLWVAVSATSGQVGASMHTGATAQGRVKVGSGIITETRMWEPGSGYPKGLVSATTYVAGKTVTVASSATTVITLSSAASLTQGQAISFASAFGNVLANTTYYVYATTSSSTSLSITTSYLGVTAFTVGSASSVSITGTASALNTITVDNTENIIANQPIEFQSCTAGGLVANTTYYVIGSTITSTSFQIQAQSGTGIPFTVTPATAIGGTYTCAPIYTIGDVNHTTAVSLRVRTGDGALGNPSFINRGTLNTTATALITGDGYADLYQSTNFISVSNLFAMPQAGANIVFGSISGAWYKLVTISNILGIAGNYTAVFQISPSLTVYNAPPHNTLMTTTIKYSQTRLTGHDFLYIGTGNQALTNYPFVIPTNAIQSNQTSGTGGGRVFFTSTDQDGNFNVGNLFGVQQATGTATLNANAFNLSGLQSLTLSGLSLGVGSATITQFSTDPYFTANSDNVLPTQRAIKSYITAQIGGGQSTLNVNTLTAGVVYIANNTISTTSGGQLNVTAKMNFTGGIDGAPVALGFFLQR